MPTARDAGILFGNQINMSWAAKRSRPHSREAVGGRMLDENAVVDSVCCCLESSGYQIVQRCHTSEKGVDIVALDTRDGRLLRIEAKGGTSSVATSKRFGQPYTQKQVVFHQVAMGVFTVLQLHSSRNHEEDVGLAMPNTTSFRHYLGTIGSIFQTLNIKVFLLNEDGTVEGP